MIIGGYTFVCCSSITIIVLRWLLLQLQQYVVTFLDDIDSAFDVIITLHPTHDHVVFCMLVNLKYYGNFSPKLIHKRYK